MIVADMIKDAVNKKYSSGDIVTCADIVQCTLEIYDVNPGSLLPSDYCINHKNKDPYSGKHPVFEYLGWNKYRVL